MPHDSCCFSFATSANIQSSYKHALNSTCSTSFIRTVVTRTERTHQQFSIRVPKRCRSGNPQTPKCSSETTSMPPGDEQENEKNDNKNKSNEDKVDETPMNQTLRVIMAILASAGSIETLYLTYNKIFSSPGAICATQGCLDVLSGPFSTFFGIPLSLIGSLSYTIFAYVSLYPVNEKDKDVQKRKDAVTKPILLFLSTAQFSFSLYLVFLLKFIIKSFCPYCIFSAVLSASLFILTAFIGKFVSHWKSALTISSTSFLFTCLVSSLSLVFAWPMHIASQPLNPGDVQSPPAITAKSDRDSLRIAKKLSQANTKMYGAFWCTHCYDQKQRFGKQAFDFLKYVECDKNGANNQAQLCRDKRIPGYPTWEINGELFPGEIQLEELERLVDEASKP